MRDCGANALPYATGLSPKKLVATCRYARGPGVDLRPKRDQIWRV